MTIPIRYRILVALLLVVTTAMGVITFVMAREFHEDKRTYLNDLTVVTALSTAEECRSVLVGYEERARVCGRILGDESMAQPQRIELLESLFSDFGELIALSIMVPDNDPMSVFDGPTLEAAGLETDALMEKVEERLPPLEQIRGGKIFLESSTMSASLPMLTLAIPLEPGGSDKVVVALLRLGGLQRLAQRSGVFEVLLVDAAGVLLAHPESGRPIARMPFALPQEAEVLRGEHSAGITVEFESNEVLMIGGYASAGFGGVVAGVHIPEAAAYIASRQLLSRLLAIAFVILVFAAVIGLLSSHQITRPMERLALATKEIAKGRFDVKVDVRSRDEIGTLGTSFRRMGSELQRRESELKAAHGALVQSEKMAAFGQLGAGIAHEVKNPLAGILGCAQLSLRSVAEDAPVRQNLELIERESRRCKTILENLLKFARQEKAVLSRIEVNPVVVDAAAIARHQLELNRVKLEVEETPDLPVIQGNANQLQQVLLNLMMNAQQAIGEGSGRVWVRTGIREDGLVEIRVKDNGPGMPPEVRDRIFEPFYTTKPTGEGTGLGLSVSYGIIQEHRGQVEVLSEPGLGTEFVLAFPPARIAKPRPGTAPAPPSESTSETTSVPAPQNSAPESSEAAAAGQESPSPAAAKPAAMAEPQPSPAPEPLPRPKRAPAPRPNPETVSKPRPQVTPLPAPRSAIKPTKAGDTEP